MMVKVAGNTLLLIAGAVWLIAGFNVALLGVQALVSIQSITSLWLTVAAAGVFVLFHIMFQKMVAKHIRRIIGYNNAKTSILKSFDARGYLIMIFMMTMGFGLRFLGVFPTEFIAFFYTGLGVALAFAGVTFMRRYLSLRPSDRSVFSTTEPASTTEPTSE